VDYSTDWLKSRSGSLFPANRVYNSRRLFGPSPAKGVAFMRLPYIGKVNREQVEECLVYPTHPELF
jgi:hypothetical protein